MGPSDHLHRADQEPALQLLEPLLHALRRGDRAPVRVGGAVLHGPPKGCWAAAGRWCRRGARPRPATAAVCRRLTALNRLRTSSRCMQQWQGHLHMQTVLLLGRMQVLAHLTVAGIPAHAVRLRLTAWLEFDLCCTSVALTGCHVHSCPARLPGSMTDSKKVDYQNPPGGTSHFEGWVYYATGHTEALMSGGSGFCNSIKHGLLPGERVPARTMCGMNADCAAQHFTEAPAALRVKWSSSVERLQDLSYSSSVSDFVVVVKEPFFLLLAWLPVHVMSSVLWNLTKALQDVLFVCCCFLLGCQHLCVGVFNRSEMWEQRLFLLKFIVEASTEALGWCTCTLSRVGCSVISNCIDFFKGSDCNAAADWSACLRLCAFVCYVCAISTFTVTKAFWRTCLYGSFPPSQAKCAYLKILKGSSYAL